MARYLDPKNDLIFKRIFGEHPHLLIKFLNALMPLEPNRFIQEIQYLSTEQVPDIVGKKNSIVDVKCIDNFKNQFIVEMQMYWSEAFNNRMVFNAGKAYARQLNKNENYDLLQPVYTLAIINDVFDHKTKEFYHHFQIVNKENTDEIIKGLEFVLVELPKFQPQNWKDRKLAVLWLRFLSEVGEEMRTLPKELEENEDIRQAAELCEQAAFTPEELEQYEVYWDAIRMEKTVRSASLREGEAIGLKIGLQKGEAMVATKTIEIAKKLQSAGVAIDVIAHTTGLSIAELHTLFSK